MLGKKETTRGINIFYLTVFLGVFGTGLVLFFKFHVGDGSMRGMFLGVPKPVWLNIHRAMAIAFLTCFTIHIGLHWSYITNIAKRWRVGLPKRIKTTSRHQLLLLIESIVVIGIGFYTWIILSLSGSVYQSSELHHHLIDLHNIAGLFLLLSLTIHIKRRWHQVFRLKKNVPSNTKVITDSPDYSSRGSAIIFHNPFTRHTRTEYVQANIHKCKAWI